MLQAAPEKALELELQFGLREHECVEVVVRGFGRRDAQRIAEL
jgi:hypothetical protein